MLESLGLRHDHDEVVRRDRIAELESEIAAFEREMDGRLAIERERAAAGGI